MKIALIGAGGTIGQAIAAEAASRGHEVVAIVRDPSRVTLPDGVTVRRGDVTDGDSIAAAVQGADAVVATISGRRDGSTAVYTEGADTLIETLPRTDVARLLWVGGAGSLLVGGRPLLESPDFPDAYKAEATAAAEVLRRFRDLGGDSLVEWTYFSPAIEIGPGPRTGSYRLESDVPVFAEDGSSTISYADYAVALVDELEQRRYPRQRFTAGY